MPELWRVAEKLMFRRVRRHDEAGARRIANLYARLRPGDPHAWLIKSEVEKAFSDKAAAEEVVREGLRSFPHNAPLLSELSRLLIARNQLAEAEQAVATAIDADPDSPSPYLCAAVLASSRRDVGVLLDSLRLAEERLSGSKTWFELLDICSLLIYVPKERDHLRELLRRALKVAPKHPLPYLWLGVVDESRDPQKSEQLLKRARRLWPRVAQGGETFEEAMRLTRDSVSTNYYGD